MMSPEIESKPRSSWQDYCLWGCQCGLLHTIQVISSSVAWEIFLCASSMLPKEISHYVVKALPLPLGIFLYNTSEKAFVVTVVDANTLLLTLISADGHHNAKARSRQLSVLPSASWACRVQRLLRLSVSLSLAFIPLPISSFSVTFWYKLKKKTQILYLPYCFDNRIGVLDELVIKCWLALLGPVAETRLMTKL